MQTSQWGRQQIPAYKGRRSPCGTISAVIGIVFLVLGLVFLQLPGVRFSGWLFLGLAALCFLWLALRRWSEISLWGKACKWMFLVSLFAVGVALFTLETAVILSGRGDALTEPVDAVIVLGAGVNGERPSLTLQTRIDQAAEYLKAHPNVPAVLSGGQGPGEQISEAEAMRRALTAQGIDGNRLLLEDQSTNTAENFQFSGELLRHHDMDPSSAVIGVVTNDFHLFRAEILASREGMSVRGIPAELPWWWLEANYYIRESFASVKTLLFD